MRETSAVATALDKPGSGAEPHTISHILLQCVDVGILPAQSLHKQVRLTYDRRLWPPAVNVDPIKGDDRRVHDLAEGNRIAAELAKKYGKSKVAIDKFKVHNGAEIAKVRDEINAGFVGSRTTSSGSNGCGMVADAGSAGTSRSGLESAGTSVH